MAEAEILRRDDRVELIDGEDLVTYGASRSPETPRQGLAGYSARSRIGEHFASERQMALVTCVIIDYIRINDCT
jgi:hypothetical protein